MKKNAHRMIAHIIQTRKKKFQMRSLICTVFIAVSATSSVSDTDPAIPGYLRSGISKFMSDAGVHHIPQAELMTSLALTGHAGKNLHQHRVQLHSAPLPGTAKAVFLAKRLIITPLDPIFEGVEKAHKAILYQAQNPMPSMEILTQLAFAMTNLSVASKVCERLASFPNPDVAGFYSEMAAVLKRALGLRKYLLQFPPVFTESSVDSLLVPNEEGNRVIEHAVYSLSQGYTRLISMGADTTTLASAFARTEFDRIWE